MIVKYQYPAAENAAPPIDQPPRDAKRFAEEEDGVMVVFSMFIILIILMVGGIGVDTMRFEMERTRLQNTIDRAVLAAADLDQTLTPKAVVEDYFVKAGITDVVPTVTPTTGIGFKTVSAAATRQMDTQFMRMSGVDTMTIPAGATAEERVPNVEVSLVLDISGSMKDNNRLVNLRTAAKEFIDATIKADTVNRVSINVVPYSEHVNVGPIIFDELNVSQRHSYSHCIEFDDADFTLTAISTVKLHQQMQHFQWNTFSNQSGTTQNTRHDTVCPRNGFESVTAMSQNAAALKASVDAMRPRAGTAIYLGMKWGAYMLDPSFRPLNVKLSAANRSDPNFTTRPAEYSDSKTLKTIVVMSDGENSSSARITSPYYGNSSHYAHWNDFNFNWYLSNYVNSWQR